MVKTDYTLGKARGSVVPFFKDGKPVGSGMIGVESVLHAVWILENGTKDEFYIAEGSDIFLVKNKTKD